MSGSENPITNDGNGNDGRRKGNKRRKALLLSIIALSLLSLFILLGNPGLLIPPNDDDNKEAEAVVEENNDVSDDSNSNIQNDTAITDSNGSSDSNNLNNTDNSNSQSESDAPDNNNDDNNSHPVSNSTSNDDNNETNPGTGSSGGSNGNGGSSHRPQASDGNVTTMEDTPVNIKMNATDFDGNSLTYAIVTQPLNGSLQDFDENTGRLTYVPAAGYTGSDSFSFRAEDARLESDPAVIGIEIIPVAGNSPPVANDIEVETDEDTPILIDLISNVIDADGDDLSLSIITPAENGDALLNENGTVTYTPGPDYFGEDTFTFRGNDSLSTSNVATVSITVESVVTIHMESTTASYGSSLYSGRQIYAEYVSDSSSLVGKEIDMIVIELFKFGNPEGTAEIGVFNEDLSVKRLFGTMNVSTISSWPPEEYTFMLPNDEDLYMMEAGDRIGIKFDGGSQTDNVQVKIDDDPADPFDGTNSYRTFFSNQWEDRPEGDLWMILANTR